MTYRLHKDFIMAVSKCHLSSPALPALPSPVQVQVRQEVGPSTCATHTATHSQVGNWTDRQMDGLFACVSELLWQ